MNASVAIQTLPEAKNDEELIRIVDEVIAYIKSTGLNYYVGPFETAIEGDYDELMDIVKECQHIAIRAGAPSVAAYIKVTYKPSVKVTFACSIKSGKSFTNACTTSSGDGSKKDGTIPALDSICHTNSKTTIAATEYALLVMFCNFLFNGKHISFRFVCHFGSGNRVCCCSFNGSFSRILQSVLSDYGDHTNDTDDCDCSASCTVDGIRDGAESNFDCDCDFFPDRNRIVGRISVG